MNNLVRFFAERPLMSNILIIGFIAFALNTLRNIQKEGFPEVSFNTITIQTIYPGASAVDVETNVTVPIEEALEGVAGVSETTSVSRENMSIVTVVADDDARADEFERVFSDVRQAIDAIDDLPTEIDGRPVLKQVRSQDMPILEIAISGPYEELKTYIPRIEKKLRRLPNVAQVHKLGFPDEEVKILVDPKKAKEYQVDLRSVVRALQNRNLEGTAGSLENFDNEKKVVVYNKITTEQGVLDTILRQSIDGKGVTLGQIATVEKLPKETNLLVRSNGRRGLSLQIVKKDGADIIKTIDKVSEATEALERSQSINVQFLNDKSAFTRNRLKLLGSNALIGFGLVVLLLFIVFGGKTALWTAFGIPFSLLGAVIMLPLAGATFNALSIGGFVIVLGLLVDDAIVVSEQINKNLEDGMKPVDAAVKGVSQIWKPVMASAVTTVIAFSPLTQMGGMAGKFIWIIPVVVMIALIFSLIESYFFLPVHLSHGRTSAPDKHRFFDALEKLYERVLDFGLRIRYLVYLLFVGILAGTVYLTVNHLPKEVFPQDGAEAFTIEMDLPSGSSLQKTEQEAKKLEAIISRIPQQELVGYTTRVGTLNPNQSVDRGSFENKAISIVYLTSMEKRSRTASEIISSLRPQFENMILESTDIRMNLIRMGPPIGKAFEIEVTANDENLRMQKISALKDWLAKQKGVLDIGDDIIAGKQELRLKVNENLLAQTGLTVSDLMQTFRIALDGLVVTKTVSVMGSTDYRVRLDAPSRSSAESLRNLQIMNSRGRMINLGALVEFEEFDSIGEQQHKNGERTNTVYGNLDKTIITPEQISKKIATQFPSDDQVAIRAGGESEDNKEIFGDLVFAAGLALMGTYFVIAIILNSLVKPLIVMSIVPFGVVGIIGALFAHGMPLSMFAMISLIGLTGITVNGSILMLYTISGLKGNNYRQDIIEGAKSRLRPILLSTLTTFLGLIPTAYGVGGSDPFISPMCLTMSYGLLFSTLVLLFLVPSLYMFLHDLENLWSKIKGAPAAAAAGALLIALALALPTELPAQAAPIKTFHINQTPELLRDHPLIQKAQEEVREEQSKRQGLDGKFDSSYELSPLYMYQESEPERTSGLTGEQQQTIRGGSFKANKMLKNGMIFSGTMSVNNISVEPGELAAPPQQGAAPQTPKTIETHSVQMGINVVVPLIANPGSETHQTQTELQEVMVKLKSFSEKITQDQLELAAIGSYWQAWQKKNTLNNAQSAWLRAKKIHDSNQKKLKMGLISRSEAIISDLNVLGKRDAKVRAEHELKQALLKLGNVFHIAEPQGIVSLKGDLSYASNIFTPSFFEKSNRALKMLTAQNESVDKQLTMIRLSEKDTLNLLFGVETEGQDEELSESATQAAEWDKKTYTAGLTWKFQPTKSSHDSDLRSSLSRKQQVALERKNTLLNLKEAGNEASAKIKMYSILMRNLKDTHRGRKNLVREQQKEFEQGRISTKEYLESVDLLEATQLQEDGLILARQMEMVGWLAQIGRLDLYYKMIR